MPAWIILNSLRCVLQRRTSENLFQSKKQKQIERNRWENWKRRVFSGAFTPPPSSLPGKQNDVRIRRRDASWKSTDAAETDYGKGRVKTIWSLACDKPLVEAWELIAGFGSQESIRDKSWVYRGIVETVFKTFFMKKHLILVFPKFLKCRLQIVFFMITCWVYGF